MQLGREKNPTLLHALMAWLNCPRQSASVGVGTAFKGAVATAWGGELAGAGTSGEAQVMLAVVRTQELK